MHLHPKIIQNITYTLKLIYYFNPENCTNAMETLLLEERACVYKYIININNKYRSFWGGSVMKYQLLNCKGDKYFYIKFLFLKDNKLIILYIYW